MAKRIIFKSRERTVRPKKEMPRSEVVRLTPEAFDVIARISLETHMPLKQVASEAIMCVAENYQIEEDIDDTD